MVENQPRIQAALHEFQVVVTLQKLVSEFLCVLLRALQGGKFGKNFTGSLRSMSLLNMQNSRARFRANFLV